MILRVPAMAYVMSLKGFSLQLRCGLSEAPEMLSSFVTSIFTIPKLVFCVSFWLLRTNVQFEAAVSRNKEHSVVVT